MHEQTLLTPYGYWAGIVSNTTYADGRLESVILREPNMLLTHAGELIPLHDPDPKRRKYKGSVTFHPGGMVKSVSLQDQQDIITPIGEFPAELVTFYETGELHRFFVLDGQLSGFWTEEDERACNIPLSFDLGFAVFTAPITGICFYKSGAIRTITLFPGEVVPVRTAQGEMPVRTGLSLYESGALQSLEPAEPTRIRTPIGILTAYDPDAIGICADSNSLAFDEDGRVLRLTTVSDRITVLPKGGALTSFAPRSAPSPLDPEQTMLLPLRIAFDHEKRTVSFTDREEHTFALDATFSVSSLPSPIHFGCAPADCTSCSLCKK